MRNFTYFLFAIVIFLSACGKSITQQQEENLTQLKTDVDSVAIKVAAIDSSALNKLTTDFFYRKNYVQKEMNDTISRELLFKVDEFVQLRKGMGFLSGEYRGILNESQIMQKQLVDLVHDVENNLVEEKQFNRYYQLEKENFDKLKMAAERLIDVNERMQTAYLKNVGIVDSLIEAHKAKIND